MWCSSWRKVRPKQNKEAVAKHRQQTTKVAIAKCGDKDCGKPITIERRTNAKGRCPVGGRKIDDQPTDDNIKTIDGDIPVAVTRTDQRSQDICLFICCKWT